MTELSYSQNSSISNYFCKNNRSTQIRIGVGTGAKYGGWAGFNAEYIISFIGISGGLGYIEPNTVVYDDVAPHDISTLGWQIGIKYIANTNSRLKPSLNILFGNIYTFFSWCQ